MKKALLAIFLLAVVVLVGYLQVVRQQDRLAGSFEAGRQSSVGEVYAAQLEADSLRDQMAGKELAFGDSLLRRDQTYRITVDSLSGTIDTLQLQLAQMTKQLKAAKAAAKPKSGSGTAPASTAAKTQSLNDQVLAYYNQRYRSLPKDLSSYELTVAVNEIREETAKKFNISVADLNRIRSENKLEF